MELIWSWLIVPPVTQLLRLTRRKTVLIGFAQNAVPIHQPSIETGTRWMVLISNYIALNAVPRILIDSGWVFGIERIL